jgi:hypothetical protein
MRVRGLRVAAIERGEQSLSEDEEDQLLYTRFFPFFLSSRLRTAKTLVNGTNLLFPNDQMETATAFIVLLIYHENFLTIFYCTGTLTSVGDTLVVKRTLILQLGVEYRTSEDDTFLR